MSDFDPTKYGHPLGDLISNAGPMPLDGGSPNSPVFAQLSALTLEEAFADTAIVDEEMARCCLSGIWLLHNFLGESHTLSQGISTPSGSYWHGIMHRREGDYANAKYWMRRVGAHPVLPQLATHLGEPWDPFRFVDECEQAVRGDNKVAVDTLRAQQQLEWELLFDFCYQAAVCA